MRKLTDNDTDEILFCQLFISNFKKIYYYQIESKISFSHHPTK